MINLQKKYNIEDFFIGELYLANEFGNLLESDLQISKSNTMELIFSGAINFGENRNIIDWE